MWLGKGYNLTLFIKYSPWFFLVNILFDVSNFGTIYFSYNIFCIQIRSSLPKNKIKKSNENARGKYDVAIYRWKLQRRSYICNFFYRNNDEIKKMMFVILLAFLFVKLSMEFPLAILKAIKT